MGLPGSPDMSPDDWYALLGPFGYPSIESVWRSSNLAGDPYYLNIEISLKPSDSCDLKGNEWLIRTDLLMQAMRAVEAVKRRGYPLTDAPGIEIQGEYRFQAGQAEPEFIPSFARLRMNVRGTAK